MEIQSYIFFAVAVVISEAHIIEPSVTVETSTANRLGNSHPQWYNSHNLQNSSPNYGHGIGQHSVKVPLRRQHYGDYTPTDYVGAAAYDDDSHGIRQLSGKVPHSSSTYGHGIGQHSGKVPYSSPNYGQGIGQHSGKVPYSSPNYGHGIGAAAYDDDLTVTSYHDFPHDFQNGGIYSQRFAHERGSPRLALGLKFFFVTLISS